MLSILEYLDPAGGSPFGDWFDELDAAAAAKVTVALARIEQGNLSNEREKRRRRRAGAPDPPRRRHQAAAAARHRGRKTSVGPL
jgi:hypothetical protein